MSQVGGSKNHTRGAAHADFIDLIITSKNDLVVQLKDWVHSLRGDELILLTGDLGAGKTTFVQAVVEVLGGRSMGDVVSPSFALHHRYQIGDQTIEHWDLYRLGGAEELETAGFWDSLAAMDSLVFVEWPERVPASDWPKDRKTLLVELEVLPREVLPREGLPPEGLVKDGFPQEGRRRLRIGVSLF